MEVGELHNVYISVTVLYSLMLHGESEGRVVEINLD